MKLYLIGINHRDALSRRELCRWFETRLKSGHGLPTAIAVEWDQNSFEAFKGDRGQLINLARARYPDSCDHLWHELALTMGYEADSHLSYFPEAHLIWLDEGRKRPQKPEPAKYCLEAYLYLLSEEEGLAPKIDPNILKDPEKALHLIRKNLRTQPQSPNFSRDGAWSDKVVNELYDKPGWAVSV